MKIGEIREYQCFDSYGLNDKCTERLIDSYLDKFLVTDVNKIIHYAVEMGEIEYSTISGEGGREKEVVDLVESLTVNKKMKCWGRGLDK